MRLRWYPIAVAVSLGLVACGGPALPSASLGGSLASNGSEEQFVSESVRQAYAAQDSDELSDNALSEEGLWPSPPPQDLGNFGELNDRLFRGARPTEKGVQLLKDRGVTLIINLENDKKVVEAERILAEKYGIKFKSVPMGLFMPPKLAKVDDFLATVQDPANVKVYFHCMQGRDRTGTMALCYRTKVEHWTTKKAYDEMKSYHFHTLLLGLNAFVHWYGNKYGGGQAPVTTPPASNREALAF